MTLRTYLRTIIADCLSRTAEQNLVLTILSCDQHHFIPSFVYRISEFGGCASFVNTCTSVLNRLLQIKVSRQYGAFTKSRPEAVILSEGLLQYYRHDRISFLAVQPTLS